VNKEFATVTVDLPAGIKRARMEVVDATTGENPTQANFILSRQVVLDPFAVAVISLEQGGSE
jgi:hypothetical protein